MNATTVPTETATRALTEAAVTAAVAPSIHNTQPWHWNVRDGVADLHADRDRQLRESDPDGRMMITSCGAALHHAYVAIAVQGYVPDIVRMPDPRNPDHLARITIAGTVPGTPQAMRHLQTIEIRRTDRRPLSDEPLPDRTVDA